MAKEKNKRMIRGNYDRLSDDQKKRAVKLTDDYYIVYPMELAQNMFDVKQELKNESKSTQKTERDAAKADLAKEETQNDFVKRNTSTSKFIIKGTSVLSKDWRFLVKASPEMEWVRKTLAAVNNLMDEGIRQYIDENGIFDSKAYLDKLNTAFDEYFEAAQNYLDVKDPSSPAGKRRKNQVASIFNNMKKAKLDINNMVDAIKDGAIDFTKMNEADLNGLNSWNVVSQLSAKEADGEVEWQNEGNSTDVYRLSLKDEKGVKYYLKENLPFLNENMEGFVTRRLRQLQTSQANAANPGQGPVEERLKNITNEDYEYGKRLLTALSRGLKNASEADKEKVSQKYAGYFAHNFDDIFRELEFYNKAADFNPQNADMTIDGLIQQAKDKNDNMLVEALRFRKKVMIAEGTYDENAKAGEALKKSTAAEWLTKKLHLDPKTDKAFLDALKDMTDKQIETMFRVTMGKEVELFGQMSATKVQKGNDKAAINNTATSRVAEHLGFDDVITKSKSSLVKFTRRDGTTVNQLCTISEEAPGRELIDIMKEAELTGKKIVYSPEAIRNLMRLYAIDTLCLQKDRHGRNFKCLTDVDKKTGNIIIKSLKAYDNDMSFDAVDLKTAFTDPETGEIRRNQFLPAMTQKITKDSALYKHILGTYCGVDVVSPYKLPPSPVLDYGRYQTNLKGDQVSAAIRLVWGPNGLSINDFGDFCTNYSVGDFRENFKVNDNVTEQEKAAMIAEAKATGLDKTFAAYQHDKNLTVDEQCQYIGVAKLIKLMNEIKSIWGRSPEDAKKFEEEYLASHPKAKRADFMDKTFKPVLTPEEKIRLSGLFDEVNKLYKQFNFKALRSNDMVTKYMPYIDVFIQCTSFLFETTYGDSPEMRILKQAKDPEALKALMDEHGNIEIPTLLHFDKEAKDALERSVAEYENPNSAAVMKLKETGLSDDKIAALAARNKEMLQNLVKAEEKARLFYKAAGWTTPPRNNFCLNKADYKELNGLTDLAVDPGNTYLAVDNENYLVGQTFNMNVEGKLKPVKFEQLMDEQEINAAKSYNEYIKNDEKRWKYTAQEKSHKVYNDNNTLDTSASLIGTTEYVRACMNDRIYDISHNPVNGAEDLMTKVKDAVFLSGVIKTIESADIGGLSRDKIKELIAPGSEMRKNFEDVLKTSEGKLYMAQLEKAVASMGDDMKYKKLTEAKFTAMNDMCVEGALNDVFAKLTKPEASVQDIAAEAKRMEAYGQNFGSKINVEEAFNKYIEKNPGAVAADKVQAMKNGLKPAQPVQVNHKQGPDKNIIK